MVATRSPELLARIEDKTLVMEPEMRRRMRERWDKGAINGVGTSPSDADVTTKLFPAERVTSFKYRGSLGRAPGGRLGSRVVTVRGVRPSTSERRGERRSPSATVTRPRAVRRARLGEDRHFVREERSAFAIKRGATPGTVAEVRAHRRDVTAPYEEVEEDAAVRSSPLCCCLPASLSLKALCWLPLHYAGARRKSYRCAGASCPSSCFLVSTLGAVSLRTSPAAAPLALPPTPRS